MQIDEIEDKIARNEMTAAQVFTQMKQHIDAANKDGYNNAINDAANFMDDFDADAEAIRQQFLCT
jgi:hypothetical protein